MPANKSLLYSLQRKNADVVHYLFGTMHTKNAGAYTHANLALKYLSEVHRYYAEMNLAEAGSSDLAEYFKLPAPMNLSNLYSERHFTRMRKVFLRSFGLDLHECLPYSPFYVQTIIGELVLTADNRLPLDYYLFQKADRLGKELGGVETVQRQIEILQQIPISTQTRALKLLAENTAKFRHTIHRLNKAYEEADIIALHKITKKQLGSLRNLMLTERNGRMANFITAQSTETSSFFAVGAAHLGGKTGLLYQLKKSGFLVKPVKH